MALTTSPKTTAEMMREICFADAPIATWRPVSAEASHVEPWASFERARQCAMRHDRRGVMEALLRVVYQPNLESRLYLQAWNGLREIGVNPPPEMAKHLYGVVVEIDGPDGLEVLAVYTDHTARHIDANGKVTCSKGQGVWMDRKIDELLTAGRSILAVAKPWEGQRPAAVANGQVRINLLTSSGLCCGQGMWEALARDSRGNAVLGATERVMDAMGKLPVGSRR